MMNKQGRHLLWVLDVSIVIATIFAATAILLRQQPSRWKECNLLSDSESYLIFAQILHSFFFESHPPYL